MSLAVPCPNCGTAVRFSLLSSIDAGRDPDLREAILNRTLQQKPCEACGGAVRPPPAFMYFDRDCGLWVSAHAWTNRDAWQDWEERARTNFQTVSESGSSIGKQIQAGPVRARVTFGWEALREKIVAAEHGIDDVGLELWKFHHAKTEGGAGREIRLLSVSGEHVVLAQIAPETEQIINETRASRNEIDERLKSSTDRAVRKRLEQGLYVDVRRLATSG
jgi:hypothetical protein